MIVCFFLLRRGCVAATQVVACSEIVFISGIGILNFGILEFGKLWKVGVWGLKGTKGCATVFQIVACFEIFFPFLFSLGHGI